MSLTWATEVCMGWDGTVTCGGEKMIVQDDGGVIIGVVYIMLCYIVLYVYAQYALTLHVLCDILFSCCCFDSERGL